MENIITFTEFLNEKKSLEKTFKEMDEEEKRKIHKIEREQDKDWKDLEKKYLDEEKRIKREAEKQLPKFFKYKPKPSSAASYSPSTSSELHYSSEYKSRKPKTNEELDKLWKAGEIEEVRYGKYHFSVSGKGMKMYFRFVR